jgi:hypothetical protein
VTQPVGAERPEWVKCIQHTHMEKTQLTWCGEPISSAGWHFQSLDHAAYNAMNGGRSVACKQCLLAAFGLFLGSP